MSDEQWTALTLVLCAIVETWGLVLLIRIARRFDARLTQIEEALQERGIMTRPTLKLSRKTGA